MGILRKKLESGETALGSHVSLADSVITEIMGSAGFDYLWIDTEHAAIDLNILEKHLIAARAANVSAIVRVPWNDPVRIKPVLEMGPEGIVIPMVSTREQAEQAIRACLYPPRGIRGYGPRQAIRFGAASLEEYLKHAADATLRFIQIEHIEAVRNLDDILSVEGIDGIIIGPCDLSASMGKIGEWDDPEVQRTIDLICETAHARKVKVGMSFGYLTPEQMRRWRDRGMDMISQVSEVDFIYQGAKKLLEDMRRAYLG